MIACMSVAVQHAPMRTVDVDGVAVPRTRPSTSTSTPTTPRTPMVVLALLAVYVIWGSTYLVMRWAVAEIPPMMMGAIRFTIAGGILYTIARVRGAPAPTARQWLHGAAVGGLLFV